MYVLLRHLVPVHKHLFDGLRLRTLHFDQMLWILRIIVNFLHCDAAGAFDLREVTKLVEVDLPQLQTGYRRNLFVVDFLRNYANRRDWALHQLLRLLDELSGID